MEIIIGVVVVLIVIALIGYVKAPPDTAYMISGFRKPRILIGKAGVRIPFLERLDKLSLKMFSVDVKTTDYVPNAEYINVKVDATVKIRIGQSEEMMALASKFFLNEKEDMIIRRVQDTLEGNMREIVGQMRLEEMVTDRKAFGERVQENAIPDLQKMGLEMISFCIFTPLPVAASDIQYPAATTLPHPSAAAAASAERDYKMFHDETHLSSEFCFRLYFITLRSALQASARIFSENYRSLPRRRSRSSTSAPPSASTDAIYALRSSSYALLCRSASPVPPPA